MKFTSLNTESGNVLVNLEDISYGYHLDKVISGVNLEIRKNDFVGMIGPNGGGKSTIIKLIMGIIEPWTGRISYGKTEAGGKAKIGYLPQYQDFDHRYPISIKEVILSGLIKKGKVFTRFTRSEKEKAD